MNRHCSLIQILGAALQMVNEGFHWSVASSAMSEDLTRTSEGDLIRSHSHNLRTCRQYLSLKAPDVAIERVGSAASYPSL